MSSKSEQYEKIIPQIKVLIDDRCGKIANYANLVAALQSEFKHLWCGFYIVNNNNQLELGPFQGPVACTIIEFNKGVCGCAWANKETIIVADVHQFDGHIACSSESNSEIVVPIYENDKVVAVLDLDSKDFNAFNEVDQHYLEIIVNLL